MRSFTSFSHRIFGGLAARLGLKGVEESLLRAGIRTPAELYLSAVLLVSAAAFVAATAAALSAAYFTLGSVAHPAPILLSVAVGLLTSAVVYFAAQIYPGVVAARRRRLIEETLPYTVSFMGLLAAAGTPPSRVFKSLAKLEKKGVLGLAGEAEAVYRDLELLGEDLIAALSSVSEKKISPTLNTVIEGLISTIKSGGSLTLYLQDEARSLMRLRRGAVREFLDTLTMLSEVFISVMVVFPLILIVLLAVMSAIGGPIGAFSPETLAPIIVYAMVPGAGLMLLTLLDAITPR